jgi:DNA-binding response OmpR family regulator
MPQVDGFQTMERLRATPATRAIPVLFLTSLDRQSLKIKGLELGADDYVTKPYNSFELIARIKAILRRAAPAPIKAGVISGDIKAIGLSELLQNLAQGGRVSRIILPEMSGKIITADSNLLLIRQGIHNGLEALLRLLLMERGSFSVHYDQIPEQLPEPEASIFSALLNTASRVDQLRSAAETTGQKNPLLALPLQGSSEPEIDLWQAQFPLPLFTLITLMNGGVEDNMNLILKAIIEDRILCLPASAD